jgi:hypothetical protein
METAERSAMDTSNLESLTGAVAPLVMVSAAGLLFNGVQTKNLHRLIESGVSWRSIAIRQTCLIVTPDYLLQFPLFDKRIRLSQRSIEMIYEP